jgi:hypothetical protein
LTESSTKNENLIFQNTGGHTNVAFGRSGIDVSGQEAIVVTASDKQSLDKLLTAAGLGKADLTNLSNAMDADGDQPGGKVMDWVMTNTSKVLSGAVKVGTKIGSEILITWIKRYYGLNG